MSASKSIKLEILALCNFAEFTTNGKFNIIGVYDQQNIDTSNNIWPHGVVVFTIKTSLTNVMKKIRLQIVNGAGVSLLDRMLDVKIGVNGKANFLFEFANLKVSEHGSYSIRLIDPDGDDKPIGETEVTLFPVNKGEQDGSSKRQLSN